jgi:hypothetical protein
MRCSWTLELTVLVPHCCFARHFHTRARYQCLYLTHKEVPVHSVEGAALHHKADPELFCGSLEVRVIVEGARVPGLPGPRSLT